MNFQTRGFAFLRHKLLQIEGETPEITERMT